MRKSELNCKSCEKKYGVFASRPLVFVGETCSAKIVAKLQRWGWGRMWVGKKPNNKTLWALDNGAFHAWKHGKPFPAQKFKERLDVAISVGTPYFAIAPDLVAQGKGSLAFTLEWMPDLPREWPWFLAVQDGLEPQDVDPHTDQFAGIFLGGSDPYKATAKEWCEWAHRNGLRFHYGRAGTLTKLHEAQRIGADSVDSAFPLWTQQRLNRFAHAWRFGDPQLELEV